MDEAASKLHGNQFTTKELDVLDRKIMQLEIEMKPLKRKDESKLKFRTRFANLKKIVTRFMPNGNQRRCS
jgi:ATP-dependent Clp protease ATP-binding subunit ClpA